MTLPNVDNLCHLGMAPALATELSNQVSGRFASSVATALTTVGAGTITAAGIVGRYSQRGGLQAGSAFTDTTDTAALITAAQPQFIAGQSWSYVYQNNTNAAATITGGTGVTVSGVTVVPAASWAEFLVTATSASVVTMVGIEMGSVAALPSAKFTSINVTAGTLTAGVITGAENVYVLTTNATPGAQTVRTAAQMIADTPNGLPGLAYTLRITNSGAGTLTLTADAGPTVTLTGTMTVLTNTFRDFVVTFNTATTATIQSVGTGTI